MNYGEIECMKNEAEVVITFCNLARIVFKNHVRVSDHRGCAHTLMCNIWS